MIRTGEGGRILAEFLNYAPRVFLLEDRLISSPSMHPSGSRLSRAIGLISPWRRAAPQKIVGTRPCPKGVTGSQNRWFSKPNRLGPARGRLAVWACSKTSAYIGTGTVSNQTAGFTPAPPKAHSPHPTLAAEQAGRFKQHLISQHIITGPRQLVSQGLNCQRPIDGGCFTFHKSSG